MKLIHNEVKSILEAFGYKPKVKEITSSKSGCDMVDVYFHVDGGFDTMPVRHKDAIIMLTKGYLTELYYAQDTQHIIMYDVCLGLDPDDDRYSCLLYQMRLVSDDKTYNDNEVFVNCGDHFKRFVNWIDVSR